MKRDSLPALFAFLVAIALPLVALIPPGSEGATVDFPEGGGFAPCIWDKTGSNQKPDGQVDASDLALLLGSWGPCPQGCCCWSDFNGDGFVSSADLAALFGAWGKCHSDQLRDWLDAQEDVDRYRSLLAHWSGDAETGYVVTIVDMESTRPPLRVRSKVRLSMLDLMLSRMDLPRSPLWPTNAVFADLNSDGIIGVADLRMIADGFEGVSVGDVLGSWGVWG